MTAGFTRQIELIAADDSLWQATLSEVRSGLFPGSIGQPHFVLHPGRMAGVGHETVRVDYQSFDGELWASECHSHADSLSGLITFKFTHWNCGQKSAHACFGSEVLCFLDWERNPWVAKVNPMDSPGAPKFVVTPARRRRILKGQIGSAGVGHYFPDFPAPRHRAGWTGRA